MNATQPVRVTLYSLNFNYKDFKQPQDSRFTPE